MTKRLAVARLSLEVNSFSPLPSMLADFEQTEWVRGPEALARYAGTPTEIGAVAAFADDHPDWEVVVSRCASAAPGGPMDDRLFETFLAELTEDLGKGPWDAVYISLHGALATVERPTPDLEVLRTVRSLIGRTPLGASFDMHANLDPETVRLVDVGAGYKTLPHLDMRETAERVLGLLARTVAGEIRPVGALARPGRILHSHNMRTTDGPMRTLEEIAAGETSGAILDVTPFGGFPWTDSPNTGSSVMVYADGARAEAEAVAGRVAEAVRRLAPEFAVTRPGAAEAVRDALAAREGPIAVLESGDNTYSGGIGDTPGLFRALVEAAPAEPCVFAFFFDPDTVAAAHAAGEGAAIDARLGGRITRAFGEPVAVRARVAKLTDGRFVNKGPMGKGVQIALGRTALLAVGNVQVIVTERRLPVNDLAYMELHGIDIARVKLLCVKAKNHFRAAYGPHLRQVVECDTAGPAAIDLTQLPFRYAPIAEFV